MTINYVSSMAEIDSLTSLNEWVILCAGAESWCVPCQRLAPHFEAVSDMVDGVVFAKVDIDEAPAVAEELGIMGVPAVLAFRDSHWYADVKGRTAIKLKSEIESLVQSP